MRSLPPVPLLVFAAVDVVLALLLLLGGGFSIQFWLVFAIGLALAAAGFVGLRNAAGPD